MECSVIDRRDANIKFKHLSTANFPDNVLSFQDTDSKYSYYFQLENVSVNLNISHCWILECEGSLLYNWNKLKTLFSLPSSQVFSIFITSAYGNQETVQRIIVNCWFLKILYLHSLSGAVNSRGMSGQYKLLTFPKYLYRPAISMTLKIINLINQILELKTFKFVLLIRSILYGFFITLLINLSVVLL